MSSHFISSLLALVVGTLLVSSAGLAQVSIGGVQGFNGSGTGLTISSNSTTSTSAGSIIYGGDTGDGITSISAGTSRAAWTKDGGVNSYDITTLTFTNGSQTGPGSTNKAADDLGVTGTFSLVFTPTEGSLVTLGTFAFTLDAATGSGSNKQNNVYSFGLNGATSVTASLGATNFTQAYSSSFTTGSTLVNYTVYGNSWSNTVISEGSNSNISVGFKITNIQPIPEPTTYALAGPLLLFGAMGVRRLRRKSAATTPVA